MCAAKTEQQTINAMLICLLACADKTEENNYKLCESSW